MKRAIIEANPKYYYRLCSKIYSWNAGLEMVGREIGVVYVGMNEMGWDVGAARPRRHNDGNVNKFKG